MKNILKLVVSTLAPYASAVYVAHSPFEARRHYSTSDAFKCENL